MSCIVIFCFDEEESSLISLQNVGVDRRPPGLQNPVRTWQLREFNKKFQTLGVTVENTRSTLWDSMKSPCRVSCSGFSWVLYSFIPTENPGASEICTGGLVLSVSGSLGRCRCRASFCPVREPIPEETSRLWGDWRRYMESRVLLTGLRQ